MVESSGHTSPDTIARSENKNVHPVQCQRCLNEYFTFLCAGHPDDGERFVCSLMDEAPCTYFRPKPLAVIGDKMFCNGQCMCQQEGDTVTCKKPIAPIIDAEAEQKNQFHFVGSFLTDAPVFTGGIDYRRKP